VRPLYLENFVDRILFLPTPWWYRKKRPSHLSSFRYWHAFRSDKLLIAMSISANADPPLTKMKPSMESSCTIFKVDPSCWTTLYHLSYAPTSRMRKNYNGTAVLSAIAKFDFKRSGHPWFSANATCQMAVLWCKVISKPWWPEVLDLAHDLTSSKIWN